MGIYQGSKLMSGGGGGPSPYEIAKQNGYTGTEQEFNRLLAALDQNATKQETNTLLAGKAPAGFGLGNTGKLITDCNAAGLNGWYHIESGGLNSPDSSMGWTILVTTPYNEATPIQDAFTFISTTVYYHLRRFVYPGSGTPWEWIDPPMLLGVEYRTTERYQGKPVYVKIVDCGAMPNTTTKAVNHGVANIDQCISATGITIISTGDTFSIPYASMSDGMTNGCSLSRTQVRVWSAGDGSTANANVLIKYTKTTD